MAASVIEVLQEQEEHDPLAWGCPLCREVVVGAKKKPSHDCFFQVDLEPLVPLGMIVGLLTELQP